MLFSSHVTIHPNWSLVMPGRQYGMNFNSAVGGLSAPYGNNYGVHLVSQQLHHSSYVSGILDM